MVPLMLSDPAGTLLSGQAVIHARAVSGRIIIVDREPVLAADWGTPLLLYGHPGATYALQAATNLAAPTWQVVTNVILSGRVLQINPPSGNNPPVFYRALQE